ncbi:MAG: cytochrome ubiquinol oxidase subunit I [Spirochaetota bacterium]
MDVVMLSRIQFGLAAGVHFIFPSLTLGLTLLVLLLEYKFYKTNDELFKAVSTFFIKILGLVFALGVATGIVLEFSFGTNWAEYSRMVGDIFGAPLAAEGIFAFFLESVFLGVLLFGRNKVSKKVYLVSAFLVFFGSHLSGLWIIIANSWMQTPAGFAIEGGRAVLTNFFAAALNPSTLVRYAHVIIAGWISGSLFAAGVAAWYLIKKQHTKEAQTILKTAIIIFCMMSLIQFVSGHIHSVQVTNLQPEKMATFEALWQTQKGAPMSIIGIPVESEKKTYFEIKIPKLLSLLAYFDPNAIVKGRDAFAEDELPPVLLPYFSYHIMIGLGSLFALLSIIAIALLLTKKLITAKWFWYILVVAIPLPIIANEFGWIAAEVGRQPWAVYKVLKTVDAVSAIVPATHVLLSLIIFSLIYLLLVVLFITILVKIIKTGPQAKSY